MPSTDINIRKTISKRKKIDKKNSHHGLNCITISFNGYFWVFYALFSCNHQQYLCRYVFCCFFSLFLNYSTLVNLLSGVSDGRIRQRTTLFFLFVYYSVFILISKLKKFGLYLHFFQGWINRCASNRTDKCSSWMIARLFTSLSLSRR